MLLICPVRPGDDNETLRYALRSWETNLHFASGLELLIVGYRPSWLVPDGFVTGNYGDIPVDSRVWDNVRLGCQAALDGDYWDEALVMNDDFFCMDPTGSVLPVRRNESLASHLDYVRQAGAAGTPWERSLYQTALWLAEQGFSDPASYEVHRPLPVLPGAMIHAMSRWEDGLQGVIPQWRTVYGVIKGINAYPVTDCKVLGDQPARLQGPWVSTWARSWQSMRHIIEPCFQKPSRWER